jgi:energy-coupling factor transporter transmembrane protein EcfT
MRSKIPSFLLSAPLVAQSVRGGGRADMPYIEKGIRGLADFLNEGYSQWERSEGNGFLHSLDPRIKIAFWLSLIIVISLKSSLMSGAVTFIFIFLLAAFGSINIISMYKKVLLLGIFFGFFLSAPSALNVIVPGRIILPLLSFSGSYDFWIYHIPQVVGITDEGASRVAILTLRVMNSLSVSFLVLYTTPLADIIKALKIFRVPDIFLLIITMTYKYIYTLAGIVSGMYLAKKARLAAVTSNSEAREWIAGRVAFVFKRTGAECDEVLKAMTARGFSGEIRLYHYRALRAGDLIKGVCLFVACIGFLFI